MNEKKEVDIEYLILSGLINDSYIFIQIIDEIDKNYFENAIHSSIFKILREGYVLYSRSITLDEFLVILSEDTTIENDLKLSIKTTARDLYNNKDKVKKDFLINQIEKFIKTHRVKVLFSGFIDQANNPNIGITKIDYEKLNKDIQNSNYKISKDEATTLLDVETIQKESPYNFDENNIVTSRLKSINDHSPYGGYNVKSLVQFQAPPGTGKSTLMISETSKCLEEQKKCIHIVVGDLTKYDIYIRLLASVLGDDKYPLNVLIKKDFNDLKKIVEEYNNLTNGRLQNLYMLAYPANTVRVEDLYDPIFNIIDKKFEGECSRIVVDYANNLLHPNFSTMYESKGEVYQMLSKLAWDTNTVVCTGSQPKGDYWDKEYVEENNTGSESSKKEHILDLNLVCGCPIPIEDIGKSIGTIKIQKTRRGSGKGKYIHVKYDYTKQRVEEISKEDYNEFKKLIS